MTRLAWTRILLALSMSLLAASAGAQQVRTYVQTQTGPQQLPLGYPVPTPVASLTPVDGFRDLASLHARLQSLAFTRADISAHAVGRSIHGRDIWAYVAGTPGSTDAEGRAKAAFFINATTHAREWVAPEVATGLVETFAARAQDGGLVRYLLDNTRLVIIPVQNVDGFAQTQRYPNQVLIGLDPCSANNWPRDGRMRRKNMRGADENLFTLFDHRNGVDLNRNHPPFWTTASSTAPCPSGSSPNPASLVHHGQWPHSEPEHQALLQAATLAPASRIRLGIDVHSFGRVFFSSNTARTRLNAIQQRLLAMLSAHHANVPAHDRPINGAVYSDVLDPPNRGIGAAAEYFAYEWLVPAWTLEIEPSSQGAREYGAPGVTHDGFVLPDSQIRRVRESWAESHLMAFYFMAGPPHLARVRLFDADSGLLLREQRWQYDPQVQRRTLQQQAHGAIVAGQRLRAELSFSKPMRHRIDGAVAALPGVDVQLRPRVWQSVDGKRIELPTAQGAWLADAGWRYRDDSYAFEFAAPAAADQFVLEVQAYDMVGLGLDADPTTPVDWQAGAWSGWQGSDGVDGDSGGLDRATAVIATAGPGVQVDIVDAPGVVGEGDALRLRLRLDTASASAVRVIGEAVAMTRERPLMSAPPPAAPFVEWAAGETGERMILLPVDDDIEVQGDRLQVFELAVWIAGEGQPLASLDVTVLDNDRSGRPVVRLGVDSKSALYAAFEMLTGTGAEQPTLVFDGNKSYRSWSPSPVLLCFTERPVLPAGAKLFGNGATFDNDGCNGGPLRVETGQAAEFLRLDINALSVAPDASAEVRGGAIGSLESTGRAILSQASVRSLRVNEGGQVDLHSALAGPFENSGATLRGVLDSRSSTVFGPRFARTVMQVEPTAAVSVHNTLLQQNPEGASPTDPQAVPPLCSAAQTASTGFNVASDASCGLSHPTDIQNVALPDFWQGDFKTPTGPAIDGGPASCEPVDQRGTPRPQTLVPGVAARCDIGAIELGINPYRGMWIPARPGHGIDMQTAGNRLFLLWYTFGDDGEPTVYQAIAPLTGRNWQAPLQQARRDSSGAIAYSDVGQIWIDFDSNTAATLRWQFTGRAAGSESMQAYLFTTGEPRFEVTGTWFPPAEPGNGATIVRRGEVTAAVIYYIDAAGNLRWALGNSHAADAVEMQLLSFTGFCPDCDAAQMPVQHQAVGTALFHFITPLRMRVDTDLQYPGSAGGQWTRTRTMFVPLSDPVDNRHPLRRD